MFPTGPLPAQPALAPAFFLGLDLGQTQDPSAIAVLQRHARRGSKPEYTIDHLRRYQLGTPYPGIIKLVAELLNRPVPTDANTCPLRGSVLGIDQTGVGRPVVDMFRAARPPCRLNAVTITSGQASTRDADGWRVPKRDLIGGLVVLMQSHRLRWDARLPFARELARELADFQERITVNANVQFGAWREGAHDDLVLAVAIAAWLAERISPPSSTKPLMFGCMPSVCVGPKPIGGNGGFPI